MTCYSASASSGVEVNAEKRESSPPTPGVEEDPVVVDPDREPATTSTADQETAEPRPQSDSNKGDGKKKVRKRKYVLKGGASALAIQLFGIDDRFEMRLVKLSC